ncbi:MAG: hypothetical protein MMC33_005738 [Icmadophila ericetorum]|nr:hypothetical protein [Icmadophila ericetorum]
MKADLESLRLANQNFLAMVKLVDGSIVESFQLSTRIILDSTMILLEPDCMKGHDSKSSVLLEADDDLIARLDITKPQMRNAYEVAMVAGWQVAHGGKLLSAIIRDLKRKPSLVSGKGYTASILSTLEKLLLHLAGLIELDSPFQDMMIKAYMADWKDSGKRGWHRL